MKNIQKKWAIFLIATIVTFVGVGYTLFKGTNALEEIEESVDSELIYLRLSEGEINFDPNVYEYTVTVSDFNSFSISPIMNEMSGGYSISKDLTSVPKKVILKVKDTHGENIVYTFKVIEDAKSLDKVSTESENKDYTILFIIIIIVLVMINVLRIIKNKIKRK